MLKYNKSTISYESTNKEYRHSNSRYQVLRVIDEDRDRYLETQNQKFIPTSSEDSYHVVSPTEVGRLDIISNNYYGTPLYWWAIAMANEFIDPFGVPEGVMIRIPSLLSLSDQRNEILTRR